MPKQITVTLDPALVSQTRRSAGRRASADAVGSILREYAHLKVSARRWRKAMREGRKYTSWEDMAELGRILREMNWDPTPYLRSRGKLGRRRSRI